MKKSMIKLVKITFALFLIISAINVSPIMADSNTKTMPKEFDLSSGDIKVDFNVLGAKTTIRFGKNQVEYVGDNAEITIVQSDPRTPTNHSIYVNSKKTSNNPHITIKNLKMNEGSIVVEGDATINVEGMNNIISNNCAVQIGGFNTTTTIAGKGMLQATSNNEAAAIGTLKNGTGGHIVIQDAFINAVGASNAAGIGCGAFGSVQDITINNSGSFNQLGSVAVGGNNAAGIGTGLSDLTAISNIGTINITNSSIDATGGKQAAGIGNGIYSKTGDINITNSAIVARAGMSSAIEQAMNKPLSDTTIYNDDSPSAIGNGANSTLNGKISIDAASYINAAAPGDNGKEAIATDSISAQFANNILQGTLYTENRNNPLVSKSQKATYGIYNQNSKVNQFVMPAAYTSFAISVGDGDYKVKLENSGKADNNNVWLMSEHTALVKATVLDHPAKGNMLTSYIGLFPEVFTVQYFNDKGYEVDGTAATVYANTSVSSLPTIKEETGYNTSTWYYLDGTDKKAFDQNVLVNKDMKVYFTKDILKFNVTFIDYDNKELKSEVVEYNKTATAPKAGGREGYTFSGWDQEFNHIGSDLTIKALYEINNYTVNVKYIFDNGLSAAPTKVIKDLNINNKNYDIDSPLIEGYIASKTNIEGTINGKDETYTVVYHVIASNPIEDEKPILPTPTPATPITPTPATVVETPITPQEEVIQPEVTPVAKPDTNLTEKVEEESTPQALVQSDSWALMNLISTAATILLGLGLLISKKNKEESEDDDSEEYKRSTWAKIIGVALAGLSIIMFILTQDMHLPMVMIDKWTVLMIAILIVQVIDFGLGRHFKAVNKEENESTNF
ncbi:MAG: InlB B-repeat-containing protein [Erysipelotrichaceae bacterium]